MKTFLLIVLCFLVIFFAFTLFWARKFHTNYKLFLIMGKPGSGKTTMMVKLAYRYRKKGWNVYANVDIPGTYRVEDSDLAKFELKRNSVLLIDEIALIWSNRNFKKFTDKDREWWKLYRHRQLRVYCFSQSNDCDLTIRKMVSKLYVLVNYFGVYSIAKEVKRKFPVISKDSEGESQITEEYRVSPFFMAPFGARMYTFIPRWAKYFNSFEAPALPEKEFRYIPMPEKVGRKKIKKEKKGNGKKCLRSRRIQRS